MVKGGRQARKKEGRATTGRKNRGMKELERAGGKQEGRKEGGILNKDRNE